MASIIKRFSSINGYLEAANATVRTHLDEFCIKKISELGNDSTISMRAVQRDFYQMNFLTSDEAGTYGINTKQYVQSKGQLYFISPDHIYSWERRTELDGYLIFFKASLFHFQRIAFEEEFVDLFGLDSLNTLSISSDQFDEIKEVFGRLESIYQSDNPMKLKVIAHSLLSLIYHIKGLNLNALETRDLHRGSDNLLFRYRNLIRNFFLAEKEVQFYADMLHITPNHLNAVCKGQIGRTAKSLIEQQIIEEAKVQLLFGNKYLKEVAHYLGFSEQTNFSRFFKKHTDLTPEEFRLKNH